MSATYVISPASGDSTASVFTDSNLTTKIGTLSKGTSVNVLSSTSKAYKIDYKTGEGTATKGIVKTNSRLNARKGPSTNTDIVGTFKNGTSLTIHESTREWLKVSGGGLSNVWVNGTYVQTTDKTTYGWVSKSDIKSQTTETTPTDWRQSRQGKDAILRESLNIISIFSAPETSHPEISPLNSDL